MVRAVLHTISFTVGNAVPRKRCKSSKNTSVLPTHKPVSTGQRHPWTHDAGFVFLYETLNPFGDYLATAPNKEHTPTKQKKAFTHSSKNIQQETTTNAHRKERLPHTTANPPTPTDANQKQKS